jgi:hypothetical protein
MARCHFFTEAVTRCFLNAEKIPAGKLKDGHRYRSSVLFWAGPAHSATRNGRHSPTLKPNLMEFGGLLTYIGDGPRLSK